MKMPTIIRIAAALLLGAASISGFAVQRTFVASYGLDTNPCSVTSPCRTFTRALTQTDPNGEVIVLDSAGYGTVTITQSVSILAPDGVYAGISVFAGQDGVTVAAPGGKVVLRGLTINGQGGGNGIQFQQGAALHVENCVIANMQLNGINSQSSQLVGSRLFINDTVIRDNGNDGVAINAAAFLTLDNVRIERNAFEGFVVSSGASATVRHGVVAGNGNRGIFAFNTTGTGTTRLAVEDTVVSGNASSGIDLSASVGAGVVHVSLTRSVITRNGVGIGASASPETSISVTASDNVVTDNGGNGLSADGAGVSFTASRNVVMRNVTGLSQGNSAVFRSRGDNTVAENTSNTAGAITTVTTPDGL